MAIITTDTADHLEAADPLAATVILSRHDWLRARSGAVEARSPRRRHFQNCAYLARRIDAWAGHPDHNTYGADLRARHGRKSRFWDALQKDCRPTILLNRAEGQDECFARSERRATEGEVPNVALCQRVNDPWLE